MKQVIKRPILAFIVQGFWILISILLAVTNSSEVGRWILWTGAVAWIISFLHMFFKRNYLEVIDNTLIINESVIKTTTIDLDKIEKFSINPSPLASSKIILKDKTIIKYSDNQTKDKELKELMAQYNIPVE